jgi:hypothetical protein
MEQKQSLRQWLDDLESKGHEVKVRWEGGNDDGSFWASIDDVDIPTDNSNMGGVLIDVVADHIGYGSFAGDYSTNGELVYADGEFSGADYYSASDSDSMSLERDQVIEVQIPEYLWFDSISIDTSGYLEEEDVNVNVSFNISNGPVVDEHVTLEEELSEVIRSLIVKRLDSLERSDITQVYNEWLFPFDEGVLSNGKRIFFIDCIEFSYESGEDKQICIEITDDAEVEMLERRRVEKERWDKWYEERQSKINNQ